MKQSVLFLLLLMFGLMGSAQICDPDTSLKTAGFYPPDLIPAEAGKPYEMVLQVRSITDTLVEFNGTRVRASIDSIQVVDVLGLPQGFTYSCYAPNCVFLGDETRCAVLTGNPETQDIGTYPLEFAIVIYARLGILRVPQPDTIRNFTLFITDSGMSTGSSLNLNSNISIYPQPASSLLYVSSAYENIKKWMIFDLKGREVLTADGRVQSLQTDLLGNGLYVLNGLRSDGTFVRKKVVIQH